MKAFKVFIKPLEASQRSVKIKILVNFLSLPEIGTRSVKRSLIVSLNIYKGNAKILNHAKAFIGP